ncbi:MAG: ZIP family metal transporter [archaeon]
MLETWIYTIGSVVIVSLISLIGLFTISVKTETLKNYLHYLISFSAGALLGDVFIHLLPEAVAKYGFGIEISLIVLGGIVFSFIVEKFVRWRHCHMPVDGHHTHPLAFMNLIGDAFHNFIDGLIIGASYMVALPVGIATTLAVIFHEIPQEIGDFGVLIHSGLSRARALTLNFASALASVLGAIIALLLGAMSESIVFFMVPFAAGAFIYIAGSDLIPELHHEDDGKKSFFELVAFILGVAIMLSLLLFE